jgi:hypothetical protein
MNWRVALLAFAAAGALAQGPREVHGSGDAYADGHVALAWAILRGATEATTIVVIRIEADARAYRGLAVVGADPFTKTEALLQPPTAIATPVDVRVPRARFADLPRTEVRLFATATPSPAAAPDVVVYYVGVPDTTPEFADAAKLDSDLSARIARARAAIAKEPK